MDIQGFFQNVFLAPLQSLTPEVRWILIGGLMGWAVGYLGFMLLSSVQFSIARYETRLRIKGRDKKKNKASVGGMSTHGGGLVNHALMIPEVNMDHFYGLSGVNWPLFYGLGALFGFAIAVATSPDPLTDGLIYGAVGGALVYGLRMYIYYTRKLMLQKSVMDTLDILANEIYAQNNSLSLALNSLREHYINHYDLYGKDSWYFKNPVLTRLIYLVAISASFAPPMTIINKLSEELGAMDSLKRVAGVAASRIATVGDAGPALREAIDNYYEDFSSERLESIEQYGDKLYFPIMITHFLPFLVIILWPIVETIYGMMMGNSLTLPGL